MFTHPEEAELGMKIGAEAVPQTPMHVFPRIVRMFTHPDEVARKEHETDK
jgi:hypothetical protein